MAKKRLRTIFLGFIGIATGIIGAWWGYRFFVKMRRKNNDFYQECGIHSRAPGACDELRGGAYDRLVRLIEASRKARDLEHMYLRNELDVLPVDSDVIQGLIKALAVERVQLKRYMAQLRKTRREAMANKKLKSFRYYLQVIDDCMHDLDCIIARRAVRNSSQ